MKMKSKEEKNTELNQTEKKISKFRLTIHDITLIGMMVAVIEVCKVTLSFLPNIELTSFWLILFTIYFGWKIVYVVPVFILIEGFMYGIHFWWIMYLYVWPLLVLVVWIFHRKDDVWFWSFVSAFFGLSFGFLCSLVYVVIGTAEGGLANGLKVAFAWWISGIPWDIVHGAGNFVLMLVLYKPVRAIMRRMSIERQK